MASDIILLGGFAITVGSTLLAVGYAHGRTQEALRGIIRRLDTLNNSQLHQDEKLLRHGERISHIEGQKEGG